MEQPPSSRKNCTSKFALKKIKDLATRSYHFLNFKVNSFKSIIYKYMSPYLVLLHILEFSLARLAMSPSGLDSNVTKILATCYQAI